MSAPVVVKLKPLAEKQLEEIAERLCQSPMTARLSVSFLCEPPDKAGKELPRELNGARCALPTGEAVEVHRRRVALFDLARELNQRGYGDWLLQAHTPAGTPSLRGQIKVMAGLTVTERDKEGLRLEKYRPFPSRGRSTQRDLNTQGSPARVSETAALGPPPPHHPTHQNQCRHEKRATT